jgi:hypothetical protein
MAWGNSLDVNAFIGILSRMKGLLLVRFSETFIISGRNK